MTQDNMITFAIPKGRLLPLVTGLLRDTGLMDVEMERGGRRLMYIDEEKRLRYLICRAADAYLCGIWGRGSGGGGEGCHPRAGKDICELLDLGWGVQVCGCCTPCQEELFQEGSPATWPAAASCGLRQVPQVAESYLRSQGLPGRSSSSQGISSSLLW